MSTLTQFVGQAATKGIVQTPDGWGVLQNAGAALGTAISFGATTANVYKNLVTINGRGWLDYLGYLSNASTSRTVKIRITIDGTVVLTSTSGTIATGTQYTNAIIGKALSASAPANYFGSLRFNTQLLIDVQDNVGGTIDQSIYYIARTE